MIFDMFYFLVKQEEMKPPAKKITRVFVARIPPSVTDDVFRRYFGIEQIALNCFILLTI